MYVNSIKGDKNSSTAVWLRYKVKLSHSDVGCTVYSGSLGATACLPRECQTRLAELFDVWNDFWLSVDWVYKYF